MRKLFKLALIMGLLLNVESGYASKGACVVEITQKNNTTRKMCFDSINQFVCYSGALAQFLPNDIRDIINVAPLFWAEKKQCYEIMQ